MTPGHLINLRLHNQQIATTDFNEPHQLVNWMIAMQSQDWAMAKWGIGLRLPGLKDTDVEKAFNEGTVLRTHVMRPTWHFVTPSNIRWLLALTAPRVKAFVAYYDRQLQLDNKIFKRSNDVLAKALEGGKFLTRAALQSFLQKSKIKVDGTRMGHMLMHAELDAVICSGPRQGKQFTYALLDERAPAKEKFDRQKALVTLTKQYFTSRGPATIQDFTWWSGLSITDVKEGISLVAPKPEHEMINGHEHYFVPASSNIKKKANATFLLPDYDEYGISYKDRSAIFDKKNAKGMSRDGNLLFNHMIIINGMAKGTWQKTQKGKAIAIKTTTFEPLNKTAQAALDKAVKRYVSFYGN
jgi:hypothetical protein